jgi:2OG-Fe(II) oxygenase superfamily
MTSETTIAEELQTWGFAFVAEPYGFQKKIEEAYRCWKNVFMSRDKYLLKGNSIVPFGYVPFVFPRGYEMLESFYYHPEFATLPEATSEITLEIVESFVQISKRVSASLELLCGRAMVLHPENGSLRIMRYPALEGENESSIMRRLSGNGKIRCSPHTDLNAITILPNADSAGLQLLKNGSYESFDNFEGHLLIHVGQELEQRSQGRFPAAMHRVLNPPKTEQHLTRMAMAFFVS